VSDLRTAIVSFVAAWFIRLLRATVRLRHHGDERLPPDGRRRNGEEHRVEAELDDRHDGEGTAGTGGTAGGGTRPG